MPDNRVESWQKEVESLPDADLVERWTRDFDVLAADVRTIHRRRVIFRQLEAEMLRRAAQIDDFYVVERFLRPMYVDAQAVALRRLNDGDVRSRSFRIMLNEMRLRPAVVSRRHYVGLATALYQDDPAHRRVANKIFDGIAGEGRDHPSVETVAGYLKQLDGDLKLVGAYVNKNVAHRDRIESHEGAPIWPELDAAINRIEDRMNDVGHLLTGVSHAAAPVLPPLWQEEFRQLFESKPPRQ